ncbi:MAG: hypothetical protein AB7G06_03370 [Bdellovibrionales bacterium]
MNISDVVNASLDITVSASPELTLAKSTVKSVFSAWLENRKKIGQKIILEEIKDGNLNPELFTRDDTIFLLNRFAEAVRMGRAKENLRLIAKAVVGAMNHPDLMADDFNCYVDALENLSRNEIVLLGNIYSTYKDLNLLRTETKDIPNDANYSSFSAANIIEATRTYKDRLIKVGLFRTNEELDAVCLALSRTGFLKQYHGIALDGSYAPSILFRRLMESIGNDALNKVIKEMQEI